MLITNLEPNEQARLLMTLTSPEPIKESVQTQLKTLTRQPNESLLTVMAKFEALALAYYASHPADEAKILTNKILLSGLQQFTTGETKASLQRTILDHQIQNKEVDWKQLLDTTARAEKTHGTPTQPLYFQPTDANPSLFAQVYPPIMAPAPAKPQPVHIPLDPKTKRIYDTRKPRKSSRSPSRERRPKRDWKMDISHGQVFQQQQQQPQQEHVQQVDHHHQDPPPHHHQQQQQQHHEEEEHGAHNIQAAHDTDAEDGDTRSPRRRKIHNVLETKPTHPMSTRKSTKAAKAAAAAALAAADQGMSSEAATHIAEIVYTNAIDTYTDSDRSPTRSYRSNSESREKRSFTPRNGYDRKSRRDTSPRPRRNTSNNYRNQGTNSYRSPNYRNSSPSRNSYRQNTSRNQYRPNSSNRYRSTSSTRNQQYEKNNYRNRNNYNSRERNDRNQRSPTPNRNNYRRSSQDQRSNNQQRYRSQSPYSRNQSYRSNNNNRSYSRDSNHRNQYRNSSGQRYSKDLSRYRNQSYDRSRRSDGTRRRSPPRYASQYADDRSKSPQSHPFMPGYNCSKEYDPKGTKHCQKCVTFHDHHEYLCPAYTRWNPKKCNKCNQGYHLSKECNGRLRLNSRSPSPSPYRNQKSLN